MIDAKTTLAKSPRTFAELLQHGGSPGGDCQSQGPRHKSPIQRCLNPLIGELLAAHSDKVEAYRGGKSTLFGFFVGQVMQRTRGQANPQVVNELLRESLD
ncbi:MAG: hypothetical protein R3C68_05590 [Myxococcota bacterium]